jgi:hypothetical protein
MTVFDVPSFINCFVRQYGGLVRQTTRLTIACLLTGILLCRGRRTAANLAASVLSERRHRSRASRFLHEHSNDVLDSYNRSARRAINRCLKRRKGKRWLLIIDTTFQRKNSEFMESLIQYRDKSRGVPARNHAFVVGVLLTPDGVRIPMPMADFMTREFLKLINAERVENGEKPLTHRTQLDLAVSLVEQARELLPRKIEIWVVADNFFEGPKLDAICHSLPNVNYITTLDGGRALADESSPKKSNGKKVGSIEKTLPDDEFRRVALVRGKEPFAAMQRRALQRKAGRPAESVYHVARHRLVVSGLGERTVFFSWKRKRMKYRTDRAKANFKMLITNNDAITAEEAIDAYSLRWQIELMFRELKSDLGLGHYQVRTLAAVSAHVHLVLMAFLALEMRRLDMLHERDNAWLSTYRVPQARTRQLVSLLEAEAREEDVRRLSSRVKHPKKLERWAKKTFTARKIA